MKSLMLGAVALVALFGRAEAQSLPPVGPGWSQQSAAYFTGPPITRQAQVRATWTGMTQWGRTVYFATDDGRQGVMWQVNPAAPWMYKVSDGETGSVPLDDFDSPYAQAQATFAPPAPPPQQGMVQAAYPPPQTFAPRYAPQPQYQPSQQQQAAIAMRMFGAMLGAVMGRY